MEEETGVLSGITVDIVGEIEKISGLHFEKCVIPVGEKPIDFLMDKKVTLVAGVLRNTGFLSKNEITLYDVVKATDGDEVFFRSKGILERVFTNQEQKIQLGINLIDEALHEAQLKWEESLKKVSLDKIAKEVMAND